MAIPHCTQRSRSSELIFLSASTIRNSSPSWAATRDARFVFLCPLYRGKRCNDFCPAVPAPARFNDMNRMWRLALSDEEIRVGAALAQCLLRSCLSRSFRPSSPSRQRSRHDHARRPANRLQPANIDGNVRAMSQQPSTAGAGARRQSRRRLPAILRECA